MALTSVWLYLFASGDFIVRLFHTYDILKFMNGKLIEVGLTPLPKLELVTTLLLRT